MIDASKTDDEWLAYAKEVLDYNPATGVLIWKVRRGRQQAGTVAGSKSVGPYSYVRIDGKTKLVHRVAFAWVHGRWPQSQIDHINGNKRDNRICNLREATPQQNMANSKLRSDNTSGFRGVRPAKTAGKWWSSIYVNGKCRYIGTFDTPEAAYKAYADVAAIEFGEFARVS